MAGDEFSNTYIQLLFMSYNSHLCIKGVMEANRGEKPRSTLGSYTKGAIKANYA